MEERNPPSGRRVAPRLETENLSSTAQRGQAEHTGNQSTQCGHGRSVAHGLRPRGEAGALCAGLVAQGRPGSDTGQPSNFGAEGSQSANSGGCPEHLALYESAPDGPKGLQQSYVAHDCPLSCWRESCGGEFGQTVTLLQLTVWLFEALRSCPKGVGDIARKCLSPIAVPSEVRERNRDVLPLPLPTLRNLSSFQRHLRETFKDLPLWRSVAEWLKGSHRRQQKRDRAIRVCCETWEWLVCFSLNGEFGGWQLSRMKSRTGTTAGQEKALAGIRAAISHFCSSPVLQAKLPDFCELVKSRRMSYDNEEVSVALPLVLGELEPGLPKAGVAGSLLAEKFASGTVLDWLSRPDEALLPADRWPAKIPKARIQCTYREWCRVAQFMHELGILRAIDEAEILHVKGVPVLNGAFAVLKKGQPGEGFSRVTRFIMNMIPGNSYQKPLREEVGTLAGAPTWGNIILQKGEVLLWSSEDQKGAFYAWQLPEGWGKYMAFHWPVPRALLGLAGKGNTHVCAAVIPMGWVNAVPLFQHLHRQLGLNPAFGAELPPNLEWRRDRPWPLEAQSWFQFYLDDFDAVEIFEASNTPEPGTVADFQARQRAAYSYAGVEIATDKTVQRAPSVERMGGAVDGVSGRVGVGVHKVIEVIAFARYVLGRPRLGSRVWLMLLGRLVRIFEFRRPLLGVLNNVWEHGSSQRLVWLRQRDTDELLIALSLVPLAFADLRAPICDMVTVSDASMEGGGHCRSAGLTEAGRSALQSALQDPTHSFQPLGSMQHGRHVHTGAPRVFVVSLFDNIGGLMVALTQLPVFVIGYAAAEHDASCRKLVRKRWPGVLELGPIEQVSSKLLEQVFASSGYDYDVVLVAMSSPCQSLRVSCHNQPSQADQMQRFHEGLRVIGEVKQAQTKPVHWFVENLGNLPEQSIRDMNEALQDKPFHICASWFSYCKRPRLYWCSWMWPADDTVAPYDDDGMVRRVHPRCFRRDPQHWVDEGGVWLRKHDGLLPALTAAQAFNNPPKHAIGVACASSEAVDRWKSHRHIFPVQQFEPEFLVQNASSDLRLPSVSERERLMGFPTGYVATGLSEKLSQHEVFIEACSMLGKAFHVPTVALLVFPLIQQYAAAQLVWKWENLHWPGKAPAGWVSEPKFVRAPSASEQSRQLVLQYLKRADRSGADVRVELGIPFRSKAWPRSGLQARYWHWAVVQGYPWSNSKAHINQLELCAALNCFRWRVRKLQGIHVRCLHLLDSQVCCSILAKGRTSSRKLQFALRRFNALLLATGVVPAFGFVHTADNPADLPSRWRSRTPSKKHDRRIGKVRR